MIPIFLTSSIFMAASPTFKGRPATPTVPAPRRSPGHRRLRCRDSRSLGGPYVHPWWSQECLPATLFHVLLHFGHEPIGCGAVDHAMVEREAEVAHRPDCNRVVDHHRSLLDRSDSQNGDLGLADDGCAEEAAEAA